MKDRDISPVVEQTLDIENPRKWYSALMDYGVMPKKKHPNPGRKSAHYTKQSRFESSDSQIRGAIIKELTIYPVKNEADLISGLSCDGEKAKIILGLLETEGFLNRKNGRIMVQ